MTTKILKIYVYLNNWIDVDNINQDWANDLEIENSQDDEWRWRTLVYDGDAIMNL